jgi:hypothetical protein
LLAILKFISTQVVVSKVVIDFELTSLQGLQTEGSYTDSQFNIAIAQSLLKVVDFETKEEVYSFVNYAAVLGDDGESASCAIAFHRGWAIATDDKGAIKFIQRTAPHIQVLSTPEIIKHWSDVENIDSSTLRNVLQTIRLKAKYSPPNNHPLKNWWEKAST